MTDAPQQQTDTTPVAFSEQPQETKTVIEFSLPPIVTFGIWQDYMQAQHEYAVSRGDEFAPIAIQRFHAAKRLIEKGVVHVKPEGFFDEAFKAANAKKDDIDMRVAKYLEYGVCIPIEVAMNSPLPGTSLKGS